MNRRTIRIAGVRLHGRSVRNHVASVNTRIPPDAQGQGTEDLGWHSRSPDVIRDELRKEHQEEETKQAQQQLDKAVYDLYDKTLERYQAELDTLLVYAGLFSGILTAFNIEAYQLLRPDAAAEASATAIRELAAELRTFAFNAARGEAAWNPPPLRVDAPTTSKLPAFVIWVNCLWFASLVTSLSAATIALLVKQWLYEARTGISAQSRASTQLLQFRISSIEDWKVWNIALLVPLLLQIALLIFLAGLLIILHNLDAIVASVTTAFAATLFAFLIVVTLLPAFHPGCCYRSPQARILAFAARPLRNLVQSCARGCARRLAILLSGEAVRAQQARDADSDVKIHLLDRVLLLLQKPFVALSRAPRCLPWQVHDQVQLREQSDKLNVKTAVMAWHTTLDPAQLEHMRVALCGEAGAPLVKCLRHLGIKMVGDIELPPALRKRNVRGYLGPLVLSAIRQMFTLTDRGPQWESFLQKLLNVYTYAEITARSPGSLSLPDERTLRTACDVLMEVSSIENLYAALSYLSTVVDIDRDGVCDYERLHQVFTVTEQWVKTLQDQVVRLPLSDASHQSTNHGPRQPEEKRTGRLQQARMVPQATLIAFRIVTHCILRITQGTITLADIERQRFQQRARVVLAALPDFLPSADALLKGPNENKPLCYELAFGLQMLVPLLTRLSLPTDYLPNSSSIPEMLPTEVVDALVSVWRTAQAVLERPPPSTVRNIVNALEESPVGSMLPTRFRRRPAETPGSPSLADAADKLAWLQDDIARFFPRDWRPGHGPVALPEPRNGGPAMP
ncbi:hypothetical protein FKP32DRAFT_192720 [Trametes sanguinea]|nr:hypothetical protein FKP32DRAFT_192720 [Trametes sanguinea]